MKKKTSEDPTIPVFQDQVIKCLECGEDFVFTAGEQKYFWSRNLIAPKRCARCRQLRRATAAGNNHNRENLL